MSRPTGWMPSSWLETFCELLCDDNELDYGDEWNLHFSYSQTDEVTQGQRKKGWKVYCHRAYGSFQCRSCRKVWSSAWAMVVFRYRLQQGRGTVIMRSFGQACRSCQDDKYGLPGFTEKERKRALLRLFSKIRKNCYGEEDEEDNSSSMASDKVRTKPHERELCEACALGICNQDDGCE